MTVEAPRLAARFVAFGRLLRAHGFSVASEQSACFLEAIALLGPRSIEDIRQAALAILSPPPPRHGDFDQLFRAHFLGQATTGPLGGGEEEPVRDASANADPHCVEPDQLPGGELASAQDRSGSRLFDDIALAALGRLRLDLPRAIPTRRSFRNRRSNASGTVDLRRSLNAIVRFDGDIPRPMLRERKRVQRRLLLLIDISGSMRAYTSDYLKIAHTIVHHAEQVETFLLGTRLTRVTAAFRPRERAAALARVAPLALDWDGGTRLGTNLLAMLAMPRFAAFARGACVILLSDGLERGDVHDWTVAMRRLGTLAHRLSLGSPLVGDVRYQPQTAGIRAVLPILDDLVDASSTPALVDFLCRLDHSPSRTPTRWNNA